MTRRSRIVVAIAASLIGLILASAVVSMVVLRTQRFRNYVRTKIISSVEDSTGGKVDLKTFTFDWRMLEAHLTGLVIHGTEPVGSAPLLEAPSITLRLKLLSFHRAVDLDYLGVDQPRANVMVLENGQTNIPTPKVPPSNSESGLATIVNLAIHRVEVNNGTVQFLGQSDQFSARGQDLRIALAYDPSATHYRGQISMNPLYVSSGNRPRLELNLMVPVELGGDKIQVSNAKVVTPQSSLTVTGTLEHLAAPEISGQLKAHLSLEEFARSLDLPIHPRRGSGPQALDAEFAVHTDSRTIEIQTAQLTLGQTHLEAAGDLRHTAAIRGNVSLDELGTLLQFPQLRHGAMPIAANLRVEPNAVSIDDLKVSLLGGEITANARIENFSEASVRANLRGFQIRNLTAAFMAKPAAYAGSVSGVVQADGSLKAAAANGWKAQARLIVEPAGTGTPVSGHVNVDYSGERNLISVNHSQIALAKTRIDFAGELGRHVHVQVTSPNLNDFDPAIALFSSFRPPITLNGGTLNLTADAAGPLASPLIRAHLNVNNFQAGSRSFNQLAADVQASSSGVNIENGSLTRRGSQAQLSASIGLRNWIAGPAEPVSSTVVMRNSDLADIVALSGQSIPATGLLNADIQISGTVGNPQGAVQISVVNGTAYQERFDRLGLMAELSDQLVTIQSAQLVSGNARVDMRGTFTHPRDNFEAGRIHAQLSTNPIELEQFADLQKKGPKLSGLVTLNVEASGDLRSAGTVELVPVAITGDLKATGLREQGQSLGDLTGTIRTQGSTLNAQVDSNFAGSTIQVTSHTTLAPDYPTSADVAIRGLQIERVLAVAMPSGQVPARGTLSARVQATGTLKDPQASLSFDITNAVLEDQPLTRVSGAIAYDARRVNISSLQVVSPAGRVDLHGSLFHSGFDFENGHADLHLSAPAIDLRKVEPLQKTRPGISGTLRMMADLSGDFHQQNGQREILPSQIDVNGGITAIQWNRRSFGDLTFQSATRGSAVSLKLDSNIAKSEIHGSGEIRLQGDYPIDARLTLANLTYASVKPLLGTSSGFNPDFDALVEGRISVNGPAMRPVAIRSELQLTKIELFTTGKPESGNQKTVVLQNQGPITAHLHQSMVRIDAARLTGPSTNVSINGTVGLDQRNALNLAIDGTTDLSLLKNFSKDMYAGGTVAVKSTVRGNLSQPLANGSIQLKNASLIMADWPLGMSNANGVIELIGTNLSIRNLNAEAGGGKLSLTGFAGFTGTTLTYNVRANASRVRVRYANASVVSNANLALIGTSVTSLLSGDVSIERVAYSQQSDFGSILAQSATPPETPPVAAGPISGMRLNVRIRTAPDVRFQSSLAQNLDGTADLALRGTLGNPGITGRINITRGSLVFFGNKYDLDRGSISFFDPLKIEPILNVSLEASVQGVDVTLQLSGPIENLKLSYRSDPPLRFEDIVGLLATGKTPPDPNIAASQPLQTDQTATQMGESAIVGQAVASPLASRLQRVFGINQLQIDPTFASGSTLPQARVSLQQQVNSAITFTYTEDLTQTNAEIIRVEWAISSRFSAVAVRDELGLFGIDFVYKKQFH